MAVLKFITKSDEVLKKFNPDKIKKRIISGKVTPGGKKKNRKKAMGGGMMDDRGFYSNGGKVARGCGAILKGKEKRTRMV